MDPAIFLKNAGVCPVWVPRPRTFLVPVFLPDDSARVRAAKRANCDAWNRALDRALP